MQEATESAKGVLSTGFVFTFILNLLLNGVMSQLWNVFNTLQIIMALPLLTVIMPANIIFVQKVVNDVVNFQVIDKQTLKETIYEPIFGSYEEEDNYDDGTQNGEDIDANISSITETEDRSLILSTMQLLLGVIIVVTLIAILVLCKRKVLPRCCTCF